MFDIGTLGNSHTLTVLFYGPVRACKIVFV